MLELFNPSYSTLVNSPLPLSPVQARQCLAELAELVRTKPATLSASQYNSVYTAFVAGYAKFAAGTDDYSGLDLGQLRSLAQRAFAPYSVAVVAELLSQTDTPGAQASLYCTLTDGTSLYNAGKSQDGEQLVSFSANGGRPVSLQSAQSMTNESVLRYAN